MNKGEKEADLIPQWLLLGLCKAKLKDRFKKRSTSNRISFIFLFSIKEMSLFNDHNRLNQRPRETTRIQKKKKRKKEENV